MHCTPSPVHGLLEGSPVDLPVQEHRLPQSQCYTTDQPCTFQLDFYILLPKREQRQHHYYVCDKGTSGHMHMYAKCSVLRLFNLETLRFE